MSRLFNYENTSPIYEGYDSETGAIMIVAEMYEDMTNVYESMAILNSVGLALEGAVDPETIVVLEAKQKEAKAGLASRFVNVLKNLLEKVKNWFKNLKDNWIKKKVSFETLTKKYIPMLREANGDSILLGNDKKLGMFSMEMHEYPSLYKPPKHIDISIVITRHLEKFGMELLHGTSTYNKNDSNPCSPEAIDEFKKTLLKKFDRNIVFDSKTEFDSFGNIKEVFKKAYMGDMTKTFVTGFLTKVEAFSSVKYPIDKYSSELEREIENEIKDLQDLVDKDINPFYHSCEIKLYTAAIDLSLQVVDGWKEVMFSFIEDAKVFTFRALKYAKLI